MAFRFTSLLFFVLSVPNLTEDSKNTLCFFLEVYHLGRTKILADASYFTLLLLLLLFLRCRFTNFRRIQSTFGVFLEVLAVFRQVNFTEI